jgi:hypothetical protein
MAVTEDQEFAVLQFLFVVVECLFAFVGFASDVLQGSAFEWLSFDLGVAGLVADGDVALGDDGGIDDAESDFVNARLA